jgi:hypothetical protein
MDPTLVATKAMEAGFEKSPVPSTVILGSSTNRAPGTAIRVAAARGAATSFPAIDHLFLGGEGGAGGCFRGAGCCFPAFLGARLLGLRMGGWEPLNEGRRLSVSTLLVTKDHYASGPLRPWP